MNKSQIAKRVERACRHTAALLLAAVLAACAPGTGGTGTGPDYGAIAPGAQPASSDVSFYLGSWGQGATQALFEAERILVSQGCITVEYRVEYSGPWKPSTAGEVQVPVQITGGYAGIATGEATLIATGLAGPTLRISVRDAAGNPVIAPTDLLRLATQVLPGSGC